MRVLPLFALLGCTATDGGELPVTVEGDLSHSGLSFADLVTSQPFDTLRIVLHRDEDELPSLEALRLVQGELDRLQALGALRKPGGIELVDGDVLRIGEGEHTADALDRHLTSVARPAVEGTAAVVNVLYADGAYAGDRDSGSILGYAYGGGYLVLLPDSIGRTCHAELRELTRETCDVIEAQVLLHELGHLFGLVGNGAPMVHDHADPWRGHHDRSPDCVMYWSIPRRDVVGAVAESWLVGATGMLRFDDGCTDDLVATH